MQWCCHTHHQKPNKRIPASGVLFIGEEELQSVLHARLVGGAVCGRQHRLAIYSDLDVVLPAPQQLAQGRAHPSAITREEVERVVATPLLRLPLRIACVFGRATIACAVAVVTLLLGSVSPRVAVCKA